jgi:hypothetical protein
MNRQHYRLRAHQRGFTFIGWAFLLVVVAFGVFLVVRILPVYMNEYKITTAFKEVKKDQKLASASPYLIRDRLQRRFDVDDVHYIKARNVKFQASDSNPNVRIMQVSYEVRRPLFANIGLVFKFNPMTRLVRH